MVKKKEKKSCCEKVFATIFATIMITILVSTLFFAFMLIGAETVDIALSQEVGDDICKQLTGNSTAIASDKLTNNFDGKLICTIPSFDSTQNIIIKSNNK